MNHQDQTMTNNNHLQTTKIKNRSRRMIRFGLNLLGMVFFITFSCSNPPYSTDQSKPNEPFERNQSTVEVSRLKP